MNQSIFSFSMTTLVAAMLLVGSLSPGRTTADEPLKAEATNLQSSIGSTSATSVASPKPAEATSNRLQVLVAGLTVFTLAVLVGFEIIAKVPPTLHTPLMSGSNAISGITIVGAILAAGHRQAGLASLLGLLAIVLAFINVVGGFLVTHRMLLMFKKK